MAAAAQPQATPVTLDALIERAVERHGENWQRSQPCAAHPFNVFVFGDPLDEDRIVFELHDNKTVASQQARGLKAVLPSITPVDFWRKINAASRPRPVITPRPKVDNGLVTLHKLGRPFDWVDLHLGLELAPAHAKAALAELIMRKKVREVPTVFGAVRYEVITANSPDLFKVYADRAELRQYERRFGTSARWIAAMAEAER